MRTTNTRSCSDFEHAFDQLLHLVEGVVEIVVRDPLVAPIDRDRRVAPRAEHLAFGHEAGLDQVVEHRIGAGAGGRQVDVRGVFGRRLEQPGQHGGFCQRHVARRLVEVEMRRAVDAEGTAAHISAVEIELEDLVLGQSRLEPDREERFLHLALDRALVVQEQVLGKLLRDRGAALHHAAGAGIGGQRAREARRIDAEVLVEAPVFGCERGLDQMVGIVFQRNGVVVPDAA